MTRALLVRKTDGKERMVDLIETTSPSRVEIVWEDGRRGTLPIDSLYRVNDVTILS